MYKSKYKFLNPLRYRLLLVCLIIMGNYFPCLNGYELSIATIFQNDGPYLKEWIEYHRMVGVEHFWLYNDSSTDGWKEELQPYIKDGIVEVVDWPSGGFLKHIDNQRKAMKDALYKSRGITKWLALLDTDEFLLPAIESTVTKCLDEHFTNASGVYINWHHFGTGGIYLKKGESLLFNLIACSSKYHSQNAIGKSIVRPERTKPDQIWNVHHFVLEPDAKYYNGDGDLLNFVGLDLKLDGQLHDKFICLNHYTMRDEWFFHNIRLVRAKGIGIQEWLVWEHYHAFNEEKDEAIINFILREHSDMWNKFWEDQVIKEH